MVPKTRYDLPLSRSVGIPAFNYYFIATEYVRIDASTIL